MKKIIVVFSMLFLMVSCIGQKPETVVEKFISSIQSKKFNEAKKYAINDEFSKNMTVEYKNKTQQLFFESLFKNMKYEIVDTEKQADGSYVVKVSVENVAVEKVFITIYQKLLKETLEGVESKVSVEDEFKDLLTSTNVPKEKNETSFVVAKTKKGYKVDVTPDNVDVLFGKFYTAFSNLENLGNDEPSNETQTNDIRENQPNGGTPLERN